ncbi:hypothetical protein Tco_0850568, partial [Tanacetum coccineum]
LMLSGYSSGEVVIVMERLPVILEGAKVFDKKGIHPSDYSISFKFVDKVPKQGGKTHEKGMQDAGFMSPEELVVWSEEEASSPYLRTPPLKPRQKGPKSRWLHRCWVGSSTCSDLVHESVVYDGPSLPHIEKECFANDVPLDAAGTKLSLLLKKGRSRVNVTRKRKCQYKTKINRLRKGSGKIVSVGAKNGRMGSLIALNEHEGDDDPQVTP